MVVPTRGCGEWRAHLGGGGRRGGCGWRRGKGMVDGVCVCVCVCVKGCVWMGGEVSLEELCVGEHCLAEGGHQVGARGEVVPVTTSLPMHRCDSVLERGSTMSRTAVCRRSPTPRHTARSPADATGGGGGGGEGGGGGGGGGDTSGDMSCSAPHSGFSAPW